MHKETASYIRNYFSRLMTANEKLALQYHMYTYKTEGKPQMRKMMIDRGWINERPDIKAFLNEGYEAFELCVAQRIMKEVPEKVFMNNCPKCGKLARTPYARQCRHCGHSWHDLTVARFKLENTFQLTDRHFFLVGQIATGEIKQGQLMDLTMLGLNNRATIETIEFALKQQNGKVLEGIGLGTYDLTEEDKEFIIGIGAFETPFDIIKEK